MKTIPFLIKVWLGNNNQSDISKNLAVLFVL